MLFHAPAEHVRIIDEINFGNGLPEMRTWKQAEDAGKAVGFNLVTRWVTDCAGLLDRPGRDSDRLQPGLRMGH